MANSAFLDLDNPRTDVSLFEFCSSVKLVQLECIPEAMVPESGVYCISDGRIYILDENDCDIKIFDTDGKWLETFGRLGRAHNEYCDIVSFQINMYDGTIDILNPVREIIQYSLSPGHDFVSRIELPDIIPTANQFVQVGDGKYVIYSVSTNAYYLYNAVDNSVKQLGGVVPDIGELPNSAYSFFFPLLSASGQFLTSQGIDGTIYMMNSNDDIVPYFSWDTGSHRLTVEDIPKYDDVVSYDLFGIRNLFRYAFFDYPLFMNDRFIIIGIQYKGVANYGLGVYDKVQDQAYYIEQCSEGCLFWPQYYDASQGITLIYDEFLDLLVNDSVLKDERSREILHSVSEDNNAIVALYSFD